MRMPNLNQVTIIARLVRDPELKFLENSDTSIMTFSIAYNKSWKDKDGQWQNKPSYFDVKAWKKEYLADRLSKGSAVIVEGNLEQESWDTEQGRRHKVVIIANRIQVLAQDENIQQAEQVNEQIASKAAESIIDDDLPF